MAKNPAGRPARAPRRTSGLSRDLIIRTAIGILDEGGESALTIRALTIRLSTGYGALYHHVADRNDLLTGATDEIITGVLSGTATDTDTEPRAALRALALGLFDAVEAHPWVGRELSREPWRPALLDFYEAVGRLLDALAVPEDALFDAAGTFMSFVLGAGAQSAANASHLAATTTDRDTFLGATAGRWTDLDPSKYPFVRATVTRLRAHDDREQFLAGVDIFLRGVAGDA
ncbi:transcriptional regulator, TetR family [Streptomyces sp. TverLS-915]|uniref:TetR/AcrR family transcriptional regulator n=1 Tax=unclassified Streptomyces TaxID=2593676 RepID=UPI0001B538F7|nr:MULTISPECIES: TetR/AcrR family transcriptional regulator C-terminal domain-containing protein [unclassified Streptomyces]EFL01873.1 transcriptional regulator [Streptomyces sp. SPB78]SCD97014.1 transcriptional regulator, TetR family [Streptomyces sp. TverLS-915]